MKDSNKVRLDKFLSSQLNITRSDAKKLLKAKTITVNGKLCSDAGLIVDCSTDTVANRGKAIVYKEHIYIMQNKPQGIVSVSESPGTVNVIDILPENLKRAGLFPAGRLDKDTTGFVLITDDGAYAHDILSPAHHVPKTYTVTLERDVTEKETEKFFRGMMIGEEQFKPAKLFKKEDNEPVYEITITEGRYHQIKRMFASTGNNVVALHRDKIGGLALDAALEPGQSRELTAEEFARITEER